GAGVLERKAISNVDVGRRQPQMSGVQGARVELGAGDRQVRLLVHPVGKVARRTVLSQIGIGRPLGVVVKEDVEVLLVSDLEVPPGEQIESRDRAVNRRLRSVVEATVPTSAKA